NLTPGRVAQSMLSLLVDIGTPAKMPCAEGKISRLGTRKGTYQGTMLSHCEKTGFSTQKVFKIGYLTFSLLSF
ncbi:hypothetical protein, partial [Microcoleus sp. N9_A1]|uniref:hypothetical protein n=1 Tax=Microcoleus sp. N9_A1 TaxID=3055380 RepID=UPI002FD2C682